MSHQSTWRPGQTGEHPDRADGLTDGDIYRPEFFEHVQSTLKALDEDLFNLNQDIHGRPRSVGDSCLD